tara:strand:+ start:2409 stop:3059 length:651 start_codon:yes stop_codon:yes gene_type:complete
MYNEQNITGRSVITGEHQNSLSTYLKPQMTCQQNPLAFEAFYKLLLKLKPKRIIEMGTAIGGLTRYLNYMCKELNLKTSIISYEINENPDYIDMREEGIDVRLENIFNSGWEKLINTEILDIIQSDGTSLVLCDGGNKIREFNIFSEYIKPGDVIMAHDYAESVEVFNAKIKEIYWNWHEISDIDIQGAVDSNNLIPFMQDTFTKAVWVCKIKAEN